MDKTPVRRSKETPPRYPCDPHHAKQFRLGLRVLQFIHGKASVEQKAALAYLSEPMSRYSD